jgi:hypothetical protein
MSEVGSDANGFSAVVEAAPNSAGDVVEDEPPMAVPIVEKRVEGAGGGENVLSVSVTVTVTVAGQVKSGVLIA